MKIGHVSTPAADAATLARANAETGAAAAQAARHTAQAGGSTVQLSQAATGLLVDASTPEFDAAKVARVKQALADGSYRVDPEAIADKLIANAQEVLAAAKR